MTIFSKIISGEVPCAKVHEDQHTFAFMDAGQVNPGHVIVALKRPAETILDLTDEEAGALFRSARKPAGWQTVPHVHLHVLPRHENDGVGLQWPRNEPSLDELQDLAARISAA